MSATQESRSGEAGTEKLPLDGITVVALEQAVAGPLATRHLADMGARVIKLELPGVGDFARRYDDAVHGLGTHFVWLNRGKESLAVDLKTDRGREIARKLISRADVFLHNTTPGVVGRLGIDGPTLRAADPRLVVVNMSGYGEGGPLQGRKAYDLLIQAESGMISVTGTPETGTKTGIPVVDIAAACYATMSVLGALVRRGRIGEGAEVDVSLFDSAVEWMGYPLLMQLYAGRQVPRLGLSHASIAPYDAYPTTDGEVLIGVQNDRGWRALAADVLRAPELIDDPRFATNIARVAHRDELDSVVGACTRTLPTADLEKRLVEAGIPAAQIKDTKTVLAHPQIAERDRWRPVDTEIGEVRSILPPMIFHDVELPMGAVPALGEHTSAILSELGLEGVR